MKKPAIIMIVLISILMLSGCAIRTPQINGTVLDEETKQPMKAWVIVTAATETTTVAGDVYTVHYVNKGWTDDNGKFSFPGEIITMFAEFVPPLSLGAKFKTLFITAHGSECREGNAIFYMKEDKSKAPKSWIVVEGYWDLKAKLKEVVINLEKIKSESDQLHVLQILYEYCSGGLYKSAQMNEECDILDFLIYEYERYLDNTRDDIKSGYYVALNQLAELYTRKNDYKKAMDILRERIAFIERHGLLKFEVWQKNKAGIEYKIKELQKKLDQNSTK